MILLSICLNHTSSWKGAPKRISETQILCSRWSHFVVCNRRHDRIVGYLAVLIVHLYAITAQCELNTPPPAPPPPQHTHTHRGHRRPKNADNGHFSKLRYSSEPFKVCHSKDHSSWHLLDGYLKGNQNNGGKPSCRTHVWFSMWHKISRTRDGATRRDCVLVHDVLLRRVLTVRSALDA